MSDDAETNPLTLLEATGLTAIENADIAGEALRFLDRADVQKALGELAAADPKIADRICQTLISQAYSGGCSESGKYLLAYFIKDRIGANRSLPDLLRQVLAAPATHRDLAHWWLLMTALDASIRFQTRSCGTCSKEETLTGALLECISGRGEIWADHLQPLLHRVGADLRLHSLDLQVLGGEQRTGGDFGLILDFDGKTIPLLERGPTHPRPRIVPLIFQAKRYVRPNADVSQRNPTRGPQKDLLATNEALSAYIFYEDGTKPIESPLPPLVKLVGDVTGHSSTDATDKSLDLPSFLLRAATDNAFAPEAATAEDALRMIYSKADPRQLRALVVVSGDPDAGNRYASWLHTLAPQILNRVKSDEQQHVYRD